MALNDGNVSFQNEACRNMATFQYGNSRVDLRSAQEWCSNLLLRGAKDNDRQSARWATSFLHDKVIL
jgi:hypothetical protein